MGRVSHLLRIVLIIALLGTASSGIAGVSDSPGGGSGAPPALLFDDGAPSIDSNYGSGEFGSWGVDDSGLPVYHYAIDQNTSPIAPRAEMDGSRDAWHQVGNDRIQAEAHVGGRIQFWSEEREFQWLNYYEPSKNHYGGGYGYLNVDGEVYSTRYDDRPPAATVARDFGTGYFRRVTNSGPTQIEEHAFAPFGNDPLLLHEVTIRNTADRPINASWFEYWDVNPVLLPSSADGGPVILNRGMSPATWDEQSQTLMVQQSPNVLTLTSLPDVGGDAGGEDILKHLKPHLDAKPLAIFASALDSPVSGYETSVSRFFGDGGSARPDAVVQDRTSDTLAGRAAPNVSSDDLFAFRSPVELAPGEAVTLRYAYGTAQPGDVPQLVQAYTGQHGAFKDTATAWRDWLPKADFGTDNAYLARELQWSAYMLRSRAAFSESCGYSIVNQGGYYAYSLGLQAAFRDPLMYALPLIYSYPHLAKQIILYSAHEQEKATGYVPWGMGGQCEPFPMLNSGDMGVWLFLATTEYVFATRDYSILDEVVPYIDEGAGTLWDHIHLAFTNQEVTGIHGLYNPGSLGDWADFITEVYGLTESTIINGHLAYIYPRLADLAGQRGDTEFEQRLRTRAAAIRSSLEEQWTGKWYSRGYAGTRQIGVGAIYGDAQYWPMIAGVPSPAQAGQLVANIKRFLTGVGSPRGRTPVGSSHAPAGDDPGVTEVAPSNPVTANFEVGDNNSGYFGGTWNVVNGWMVWGLSRLDGIVSGAAEFAWDEYKRNSLAQHATAFPDVWDGVTNSDDACWAYFSSDPGRCGLNGLAGGFGGFPAYGGMNVHQPSWFLNGALRLAGIEPTARGYSIAPHFPLEEFSLRFPRIGVARADGQLRGYVEPEVAGSFDMTVTLPVDVDPTDVIAWVDGARVNAVIDGRAIDFPIQGRKDHRSEWAITWPA